MECGSQHTWGKILAPPGELCPLGKSLAICCFQLLWGMVGDSPLLVSLGVGETVKAEPRAFVPHSQ